MNVIRAPRFLLLSLLAGLAVFGGPPPAAIAAGKATIVVTAYYRGPTTKTFTQKVEAGVTKGGGDHKIVYRERHLGMSNDPARRGIPVAGDGAKVEHFVLFVTTIDKNGDHKADHYGLKLDEDSDDDGDADHGVPDVYAAEEDDEAALLADIDAMDHKIVELLASRGE